MIFFKSDKNRLNLDKILQRDANNFDFIRLLAASAVIYGHSFALFSANNHSDLIANLIKFEYSGSIAVYIFFFISGILITASFVNSKTPWRFVSMRFSRIWPALIVCTIFTVFLLGPVVTSLNLHDYFCDSMTWEYLKTNVILKTVLFNLPGVFQNNYYGSAVNGPLWTLPLEIRCYIFVLLTGLIGCLASRPKINLTCLLIFVAFIFAPSKIFLLGNQPFKSIITASFFLLGAFFYANKNLIIIDWKISCLLLIFWLIFKDTIASHALFYIFLAYSVLVAASATFILRLKLPGDYSYGTYIYGFIVAQTLAHYFPKLTAYESLSPTFAITLFIAFLSWTFIEKPSMDFARNYSKKSSFNRIKNQTIEQS